MTKKKLNDFPMKSTQNVISELPPDLLHEIVGQGAQATIYAVDGKAFKVFHQSNIYGVKKEVDNQIMAKELGLPVPAIYDVAEISGKLCIIMEYIRGKPLADLALENKEQMLFYADLIAISHAQVLTVSGDGFPDLITDYKKRLKKSSLPFFQKRYFLHWLKKIPHSDRLCHGDFHPYNILRTDKESIIIDWTDARKGNPIFDICNTYMTLYAFDSVGAKFYLQTVCQKSGIEAQRVLSIIALMSAIKLSKKSVSDQSAAQLRQTVLEHYVKRRRIIRTNL